MKSLHVKYATKLPELEAISIFAPNTRLKASGGLYHLRWGYFSFTIEP